jgi:protein transport protein SEC61 subunit alpha
MAGKFLRFFTPFVKAMPEIKQPQREVSFKEKLIWTVIVLLIYLIMSKIPLYGINLSESTDYFYWLRVILASERGMLTELGIGPIVTSGLIMQLLLGSRLINVNMADPYDRAMFSGAQKVLAIFLTIFNSIAYIFGGAFGSLTLANGFYVFFQLLFAGIIIILLDEVLQKGWGLGSGVSLFIAAGVAGQIFWNAFSLSPTPNAPGEGDGLPKGIVIAFFTLFFDNNPDNLGQLGTLFSRTFANGSYPSLLGIITTVIIFLIVIWFESTTVEIPLAYRGSRGFKSKYPMKLLYVSNIPVILVNALYANILFFGQLLAGPEGALRSILPEFWVNLIGVFDPVQSGGVQGTQLIPKAGLIYLLTPPMGLADFAANPYRGFIYLAIFIFLCVILGRVWVEVSGLAPRDISQQIIDSKMQVPGFRSSAKVIERILKRYIPTLVILNGMIIACLSFGADTLGALTSGTGLLIAIGIIHQYGETLAKELAASQYPGMRALLGMD